MSPMLQLQLNKHNGEAIQMVSNVPYDEQKILKYRYFDAKFNIAI